MNDVDESAGFASPHLFGRLLGEAVEIRGFIIEQRENQDPAIRPCRGGSRGRASGLGFRLRLDFGVDVKIR